MASSWKIVGARQSFQIFIQNTWFLENNRALSKFFYWDFALINIIKLQQNQSTKKNNFMSTTQATLTNQPVLNQQPPILLS